MPFVNRRIKWFSLTESGLLRNEGCCLVGRYGRRVAKGGVLPADRLVAFTRHQGLPLTSGFFDNLERKRLVFALATEGESVLGLAL